MRFTAKIRMNNLHYRAMTKRYFSIILSDKVSLITLLLQAPLMLLIMYLTCSKQFDYYNAMMTLFIIVTVAITMAILNSYREVCKEREILKREYDSGLDRIAYIFSKMTVQSVIAFLQTLLIITGLLAFIDFNWNPDTKIYQILLFYLVIFLTFLAADAFGIMISAVLKSSESAVLPVLFIIISQVVLSGALMDLPENIEWLSFITIAKWSLAALGGIFDIKMLAKTYPIENGIIAPQPLRHVYETPFSAGIIVLVAIIGVCMVISVLSISKNTYRP